MSQSSSSFLDPGDATDAVVGIRKSTAPKLDSSKLFGPAIELLIDHNGELYRLRKTRRGKLILTK